jgi:alpha-D-ribose 1-methylphosphonate 5-phosphate C-P lyase
LILLGAGREKKLYAVPPYTEAEPLSFNDVPFRVEDFTGPDGLRRRCRRCGADDSYLDEFIGESGERIHQCSDGDYCDGVLAAERGATANG